MTKATPTRKVKITLGDQERTLRYPLNALVAFEEETGYSAFDPRVYQAPTATILRALLWSGVLHEDPDLSIEEFGDMLEMADLAHWTERLAEWRDLIEEAIVESQPEDSEDGDAKN